MNRFSPKLDGDIKAAVLSRLAGLQNRKEKVRTAAAELFFTYSIYPSAGVVRDCIEQGSVTDINKDLKEFWTDLRARGNVAVGGDILPPEIAHQFGEALARVWELALEKAGESFADARREAEDEVAAARRGLEEAERLQREAQARTQDMAQEADRQREMREAAERRGEGLKAEVNALQHALGQWQAQAEGEARARQEAEARFSVDLEHERAARKRDTEILEGEIKFAKMQIDEARGHARDLRDRLNVETARRDTEVAALQRRVKESDDALRVAELELAKLRGQYATVSDRQNKPPNKPSTAHAPVRKTLRRSRPKMS